MVIVLGTFVLIARLTLNIGWTLVGRSQDMDIKLEMTQLGAAFFQYPPSKCVSQLLLLGGDVGTRAGHSFLDALASLEFKLSVSNLPFLQLAHLRVFQIIFLVCIKK